MKNQKTIITESVDLINKPFLRVMDEVNCPSIAFLGNELISFYDYYDGKLFGLMRGVEDKSNPTKTKEENKDIHCAGEEIVLLGTEYDKSKRWSL